MCAVDFIEGSYLPHEKTARSIGPHARFFGQIAVFLS
jgi:hypothetical protein